MAEEIEFIDKFVEWLKQQAIRKAELYDGIKVANRIDSNVDFFVRYAIEELGEVSAAITRDRFELAKSECIDLAHIAMLIALAIERNET
jgi:hypothetical protein